MGGWWFCLRFGLFEETAQTFATLAGQRWLARLLRLHGGRVIPSARFFGQLHRQARFRQLHLRQRQPVVRQPIRGGRIR
jgi:hypothetical protein